MSNVTNIKCIKYNYTFIPKARANMTIVPIETITDNHSTSIITTIQVNLTTESLLSNEVISRMTVFMGSYRNDIVELNVIRLMVAEGNSLSDSTKITEVQIPIYDLVSFNDRCRSYAIDILVEEFQHMILSELPSYMMDANNTLITIEPPEFDEQQLFDIFDIAVRNIFECNKRGCVL